MNNFPDFTIPSGKIAIHQFEYENDYPDYNSNNKGYTFTRKKAEFSDTYRVDYDSWVRDLGMPAAYSVSSAEREAAFANISLESLKSNFNRDILSQGGRGVLELNWEVFVGLDLNNTKLTETFNLWTAAQPNALLSFWANAGIVVNSSQVSAQTSATSMAADLDYAGTYIQWLSDRLPYSVFGGNWNLIWQNADIFQVSKYQYRLDETSWMHTAMISTVMNHKLFPTKKALWQDFPYIEYQISGGAMDFVAAKSISRNESFLFLSKPVVDPGEMFSRSVFAIAFGDGIEQWWDPFTVQEDAYYYGGRDGYARLQNGSVPSVDRFKPYNDGRQGGAYTPRSLKGMDWHVAGMWAVSQSKDIIESATSWTFPDFSEDAGATWVTGANTGLAHTFVNKQPIIIYKEKSDGLAGLLLVKNPFQDPTTEKTYRVKINGIDHNVIQVGNYASCIRIANP
jgi:hypothetical protein